MTVDKIASIRAEILCCVDILSRIRRLNLAYKKASTYVFYNIYIYIFNKISNEFNGICRGNPKKNRRQMCLHFVYVVYTFRKFKTLDERRSSCHLRNNSMDFAVITLTVRTAPDTSTN